MSTFDVDETFSKIADIVASKLNIEKKLVTMDATLQGLGADSLAILEIILRLEECFDIEINDEDAEKMTTMREVVDYINTHRTR